MWRSRVQLIFVHLLDFYEGKNMLTYQDPAILQQNPLGPIEGLTLNYVNTTDIEISPGRSFIAAGALRLPAVLSVAQTRSLNQTWTQGGPGGRASGVSLTANTTYHVFLLRRDSDGAISFVLDTSVAAANRPAGWSSRFIGSVITDGSNNIRPFVQQGPFFYWQTIFDDLNSSNYTTSSANLQSLTVPAGFAVDAMLSVSISRSGSPFTSVSLGSPNANNSNSYVIRAVGQSFEVVLETQVRIRTNTNRQIRAFSSFTSTSVVIANQGFIFPGGMI